MELPSQQAELLRILHEHGVYLSRDDIKPVRQLKWVNDPPAYAQLSFEERGPSGVAFEETETGFFFAVALDKKFGNWNVWASPYDGSYKPELEKYDADSLGEACAKWAKELKRELDTPKPWGDKFPAGSTPYNFFELLQLHQGIIDAGLEIDQLSISMINGWCHLNVPNTDYYFRFNEVVKGVFSPSEITVSESFRVKCLSEVFPQMKIWASYLRRELGVDFPKPPTTAVRQVPILRLVSLTLTNIRRFENLTLDFHPGTNLFCGENGTGKSTILRCIALALCHEADTAALLADVPGDLLALGADKGVIRLTFTVDDEEVEHSLEIARDGDRDVLKSQSKPESGGEIFVCGYGSVFGLAAQQTQSEYSAREATRSLFDYGTKLFGLEVVLRRLKDRLADDYDAKSSRLAQALGFDGTFKIKSGGGVEFIQDDRTLPFDGMADGYRVSLSWMVDLYGWAMVAESLVNNDPTGVLLVDEVDKHMHPSLQAELAGNLKRALPEMQMFLTSHNPLTVLGCPPECLHVLKQEADGCVSCHSAPNYEGFSVEDIYTDKALFAVNPFSPEVRDLLEVRQELVDIDPDQRSPEQIKVLREVAGKLNQLQGL